MGNIILPVACRVFSTAISTKMPMEKMYTQERYWVPADCTFGLSVYALMMEDENRMPTIIKSIHVNTASIREYVAALLASSGRRSPSLLAISEFTPMAVPTAKPIIRSCMGKAKDTAVRADLS